MPSSHVSSSSDREMQRFGRYDVESLLSSHRGRLEDSLLSSSSARDQDYEFADEHDDQPSGLDSLSNVREYTCIEKFSKRFCQKDAIANIISSVFMIAGALLLHEAKREGRNDGYGPGPYLMSFGLFGLAGGLTNWIAIKMLFDRVPCLYGSGVILRNFREIRSAVKNTLMRAFFDKNSVQRYLKSKLSQFISGANVDDKIREFLSSPAFDSLIDEKISSLAQRPESLMFSMLGIGMDKIKPMIKPFILGLSNDIAPIIARYLSPQSSIDVSFLRNEIDALMTQKMEEISAEQVKSLLEDIMREHLGWLIVWGNVFGGMIGVISEAAGYGRFVGS